MNKKYTVTKKVTPKMIQNTAKTEIVAKLLEGLAEYFEVDEADVAIVRTGTESSKTNEICVRFGTVEEDGEVYSLCFTINPTVRTWKERKAAKRTTKAFDFDVAREAYNKYVEDNAKKKEDREVAKQKKIEEDNKRREKAKETTED